MVGDRDRIVTKVVIVVGTVASRVVIVDRDREVIGIG